MDFESPEINGQNRWKIQALRRASNWGCGRLITGWFWCGSHIREVLIWNLLIVIIKFSICQKCIWFLPFCPPWIDEASEGCQCNRFFFLSCMQNGLETMFWEVFGPFTSKCGGLTKSVVWNYGWVRMGFPLMRVDCIISVLYGMFSLLSVLVCVCCRLWHRRNWILSRLWYRGLLHQGKERSVSSSPRM